jgi:hypothetical protein
MAFATCSECGLRVEFLPQGTVLAQANAQTFRLRCKHQDKKNPYKCRSLQKAIDKVRQDGAHDSSC